MADKIIIDLSLRSEEYVKNAEKAAYLIDVLKQEQKALRKSGQENSVQFAANAVELQKLGRELKNNIVLSKESGGSLNQLKAEVILLTTKYDALTKAGRENTKEGKALASQLTATKAKLLEQKSAIGDNTLNVGNYTKSITEALKSQIPFVGQLQSSVATFSAMSGGITSATGAMKVFKVGLASLGIGVLLVAISSLIGFLKNFDPLIDRIEQGFAGIKAVFDTVGRAIALMDFKSLGSDMANAATDAVALKKAQQDLADVMSTQEVANAKAEQQIAALMLQARNRSKSEADRQGFLEKAQKINDTNFAQNKKNAEAELNQALEAARIKSKLSVEDVERLRFDNGTYARYLENNGKLQKGEIEGLKKAQLSKIAIDKEATNRGEKAQNLSDNLELKKQAKLDKSIEANEKAAEKQKEADLATIESRTKTNEALITEYQKGIADINADIDAKVLKFKEYGKLTEQLELERIARINAVTDKFAADNLATIQNNLDAIAELNASSIQDESTRELALKDLATGKLMDAVDKEIADLKARKEKGEKGLESVIDTAESKKLALIDKAEIERKALIDKAHKEELIKAQEHVVALAKIDVANAGGNKLAAKAALLKAEQDLELLNAQDTEDGKQAIKDAAKLKEALSDEERRKLIKETAVQGAQITSDAIFAISAQNRAAETEANLSALDRQRESELSNKNLTEAQRAAIDKKYTALKNAEKLKAFEADKKAATIQAVINTALAVVKALPNYILAALAAATGIAQIAVIQNQKAPAFASGGQFVSDGRGSVLSGYSKTDNVNAKLRSGEGVVVSEAMRNTSARNAISAINVAYGGRDFSVPNTTGGYADGGLVAGRSTSTGNRIGELEQISQSIRDLQLVVSVQEIYSKTNNYIEAKAVKNV